MIKTIGHSVRSVYTSAKAKINGASHRRKSTLSLVEKELFALKVQVTQSRNLSSRVDALRYLITKL
jgi:hypothetical protein